MAIPRDTSPEIWRRYLDAMRTTPPEERVRRAVRMSDELRDIVRAGVRSRHPDWTAASVQEEMESLMLGRDLARKVRAARLSAAR
jgi:hypothetical protein